MVVVGYCNECGKALGYGKNIEAPVLTWNEKKYCKTCSEKFSYGYGKVGK